MSDDREWVANATGGTVTRFDRVTAGRSRATWLVDVDRGGDAPLELVLRRDTGDGPLSGTELSLARESVVYAALAETPVLLPRLWGVAPDGAALLVERASGTESLPGPGEGRSRVLDSFLQALASLHNVDVDTLDLPGFAHPRTPEDHALADLALWRRVFDDHVTAPAPLVRLAFRWLQNHPPSAVERTVLCHGDLGPGNFLHSDGQVTAILDWEFAHLGDPMDDIAWFTIRAAQVADMRDLSAEIARYQELTGIKVDGDQVRYYQVMVLVRMAVACLVALERRTGQMDASTYLALLPLLERQMTTLLAELEGVDLAPTELPEPEEPTSRATVIDVLNNDLSNAVMPELQTEAGRSRAFGMVLLLMHLKAADTLGPQIDRAEIEDLATLLADLPVSPAAGLRALEQVVEAAQPDRYPELLAYFSRHADRQVALWQVIAPMAARPLPRVHG